MCRCGAASAPFNLLAAGVGCLLFTKLRTHLPVAGREPLVGTADSGVQRNREPVACLGRHEPFGDLDLFIAVRAGTGIAAGCRRPDPGRSSGNFRHADPIGSPPPPLVPDALKAGAGDGAAPSAAPLAQRCESACKAPTHVAKTPGSGAFHTAWFDLPAARKSPCPDCHPRRRSGRLPLGFRLMPASARIPAENAVGSAGKEDPDLARPSCLLPADPFGNLSVQKGECLPC